MVRRYEAPYYGNGSFNCPRCEALAGQSCSPIRVESADNVGGIEFLTVDPDVEELMGTGPADLWNVSVCFACGQPSFWRGDFLEHPTPRIDDVEVEPHKDLPHQAKELLTEAINVYPHSRRASAALCRASLETLLKELDPDAGRMNLEQRILRFRGRVSTNLWKILTAIRHIGNKSLHGAEDDDKAVALFLDEPEAQTSQLLIAAINQLAEQLITEPRRTDELFESLPADMRERAEAAWENQDGQVDRPK